MSQQGGVEFGTCGGCMSGAYVKRDVHISDEVTTAIHS